MSVRCERFADLDQLIADGQGERPGIGPLRPPLASCHQVRLDAYAAQMRAGKTRSTRNAQRLGTWPRGRRIIRVVATRHGFELAQLLKHGKHGGRFHAIVRARAEAMAQIREQLGYSLPLIGRIFGGYHHTTVLHLLRKYGAAEVAAPESVEERLVELEARAAELWSGLVELRNRMKERE